MEDIFYFEIMTASCKSREQPRLKAQKSAHVSERESLSLFELV